MSNLLEVIEIVKKGDEEIITQNNVQTEHLESIDRNIMEFLGLQKRKRLDDLEDRRERKSKLKLGAGAALAGAGVGALGAGLLSDALGEGLPGKGLLGAGIGAVLALQASKMARALGQKLTTVVDGTNAKIQAAKDEVKAQQKAVKKQIKDIDRKLKTADPETRAQLEDQRRVLADQQKKLNNIQDQADGAGKIPDRRTRIAVVDELGNRLSQPSPKIETASSFGPESSTTPDAPPPARVSPSTPAGPAIPDADRPFYRDDAGELRSKKTNQRLSGNALSASEEAALRDAGARAAAEERARIAAETPPPAKPKTPVAPIDPDVGRDPRIGKYNEVDTKGKLGAGALRVLDAVDNPLLSAIDEVSTAIAKQGGKGFATKVASGVSKSMGFLASTPVLAAQLIISPNTLADGTLNGAIISAYNDMIVAMMQGGEEAFDVVKYNHEKLKGLTKGDENQYADLKPVLEMDPSELKEATIALYERTQRQMGIPLHVPTGQQSVGSARTEQSGVGGYAGDELNALDAMSDTSARYSGKEVGPSNYNQRNTERAADAAALQKAYEETVERSRSEMANLANLEKGRLQAETPKPQRLAEIGETSEKVSTAAAAPAQAPAVVAPTVNSQTDSSVNVNQTNVNATSGITVDPKSKGVPGFGYEGR